MKSIPRFYAQDWIDVPGRGLVAICDWPDEKLTIKEISMRTISIDGDFYRVRGVEYFCPVYTAAFHEPPLRPVGILVTRLDNV